MTFAELLAEVIDRLDRAAVPYMITGSLASTFHGEPRATRDIDIVIDPSPAGLDRLVDGLRDGGFYVDRDAAEDALRDRTSFHAIGDAAAKVDFIVRRDRPFSREEFARRRQVDLLGTLGFIATVEDVILVKLGGLLRPAPIASYGTWQRWWRSPATGLTRPI
ncbi:MAG: hypothetical protein ABIR11_07810 [Candidatus Limnocylindrales bacterium]